MTERCLQMRELYKQAKKRYRVPDTAHDFPILRIGVLHDQPVSKRESLREEEFFYSSTVCSCVTKPLSSRMEIFQCSGE